MHPPLPSISAPPAILDLVVRFGQQLDTYKSGAYNETQLRRDFLDPLFKALGWDMDNEAGYAEAYRDVIHEDALRIGGAVKAPDYCFRIGGTRKFFLEAKKPSVFIKQEIPSAYQLRRYGWSAKLPLSILSDFEELAVYDCRVKPGKDDPASTARVFYCTFRELAEKWDWLASIFSRDAILKGSFDKFAETNKAKRGTTEVDADFLASMETWRNDLAKNLALRNPRLSQRELNFAVQRILDRIIFLRICEDRGLEDYGRLQALTNAGRIYPRLCQHFEQADTRYNSGIFHFKPEKDRHEPPDELTLGLDVDDALLRDLLKGLYYPDSPYEFSVLSADILGQVYEQFLGKVIRLTEGHRAVVDEKPEVRKAGGVYYTPTYVADYIVRQTVGRLLEECSSRRKEAHSEKPEKEASLLTSAATNGSTNPRAAQRMLDRVAQLRILDPACGSGSFLICAYQFLLDWHLQFYLQLLDDPKSGRSRGDETQTEKPGNKVSLLTSAPTVVQRVHWLLRGKNPPIIQTTRGWRLTIAERKRILLNNIYGVDIDPQAVEVTKLSLLLKVLEGETSQSIAPLFSMFHERALPDLGDNIKCGNSLIGPDFYGGRDELPLFPDQKSGARSSTSLPLTDEEKLRLNVFDWHAEFPQSESEGGFDAVIGNPPYGAFTGEAETAYFRASYRSPANSLDTFLLFVERGHRLLRVGGLLGVIIPSGWVSAPSAKPLRQIFIESFKPLSFVSLPFDVFHAYIDTVVVTAQHVPNPQREADDSVSLVVFPSKFRIKSVADFRQFEKTSNYRDWLGSRHLEFLVTCSRAETKVMEKVRQQPKTLGEFVLVKRGIEVFAPQSTKAGLVNPKQAFTGTLQRYNLAQGDKGFISYDAEIEASKPFEYFSVPRILLRQVLSRKLRLQGIFTTECFLTNQSVQSLLANPDAKAAPTLPFLLAILNSRLLSWYFVNFNSVARRDDFPKIIIQQTRELPLPASDPQRDKSIHDRMVNLVEQMLALHRQLASTRTPHEQTALERQIAATDTQIDRLVYQLYSLTEEEIKIVEGESKTP